MTRAQIEFVVFFSVIVLFIAAVVPALTRARAEVRDDLRRQDITNLKVALEQYNNEHNHYGLPVRQAGLLPEGAPECTASADKASWLFGDKSPLLQEQFIDAIPHDTRESLGHAYRFCATELDAENRGIAGYFLEAELEVDQPDTISFDEDERRKFFYRILYDEGRTLYRICGGSETQCTPS